MSRLAELRSTENVPELAQLPETMPQPAEVSFSSPESLAAR